MLMSIRIKGNQKPGRNEPCPCGSGLKYKKCHGDSLKQALCNRVANEKMVALIELEKEKQENQKVKEEYDKRKKSS